MTHKKETLVLLSKNFEEAALDAIFEEDYDRADKYLEMSEKFDNVLRK